jgi:peptidoglycan lytic transglycosylase G
MMPVQKPRGPSPEQIRRRRIVALTGAVVALIAIVIAVVVAIPHVRDSQSPTTIVAPPAPKPFRVVFPEGFNRAQMAERVQAVAKIAQRKRGRPVALNSKQYLLATNRAVLPCFTPHRQTKLEGFLFPATYDFVATTTSRQLANEQLQTFCDNWSAIDLAYARKKNLTPYDVLIIASMVEKETLAPDERKLVAAVIYNRLHAHMPLGIDATLRYGLNIPPTKSILQSQLDSNNPYNSRKVLGLPPTPIANPGLASLRAALEPAQTSDLYYVLCGSDGHHEFAQTYAQFLQLKQQCLGG